MNVDSVQFTSVAQLFPTLCDLVDYSPPGSSVHGILQTKILEWVAISFSRGSSWPRNWTQVSRIVGRHFTIWVTKDVRWVKLCDSLSILWHCLSLEWEWKLTFSSPVATAEFSKFADIVSAALSQHHLLGFETVQLEFHHSHYLCSWGCFLRPTWLRIPGCLTLGEWSHHHDYLGCEDLFCIVLTVYSCHLFLISSASVRSIPFLSFIWAHLCMKCSLVISNFLEEISSLSHSIVFL